VFTLLLILVLTGISLGVGLFVGGLFVQGYIYTEPSPHIRWGAPVTAAVLFFFFTFWCLIDVIAGATPTDIPYDALHRFSPTVDMLSKPASDLWVVRKGGTAEHYKLRKNVMMKGVVKAEYRSADTDKPWNDTGVEAILLKVDDNPMRFDVEPEVRRERGSYRRFISSDGWVMIEYESGPDGIPTKFRFVRFVINLFLNFVHFALWFLCLWLLLRFQWSHALGFGFVMWVVFTLTILPMLLDYTAQVSQARQVPPTVAPAPAAMIPLAITAGRSRPG
jgi:hypothetical protein